jgi:hypothetical protein
MEQYLSEEIKQLPGAIYVPLGKSPTEALNHLSKIGVIYENQILSGVPHPSGANSERISYMLEEKQASSLSTKTNSIKIDADRKNLRLKIELLHKTND